MNNLLQENLKLCQLFHEQEASDCNYRSMIESEILKKRHSDVRKFKNHRLSSESYEYLGSEFSTKQDVEQFPDNLARDSLTKTLTIPWKGRILTPTLTQLRT